MQNSFGKLVLLQKGGPEQEFELAKSIITLGRAMTNEIILSDLSVSRIHAQLERTISGCQIIDLGSSNGTHVNGTSVEKAELKPGDLISVGSTHFRYEASRVIEDLKLTSIDTEIELDQTVDHEILPFSINETNIPRLVVFSGDKTWEMSLEETDMVQIGRGRINQLIVDQTNVSRLHAEVFRKGDLFILRDLNSKNGTWFKGKRVSELILQDGDVFHIGKSQIVFKKGFGPEALSMALETLADASKRRPVVFLPGSMGSDLWLGNERIWPNVKYLFTNPEIFNYSSTVPLEPRGIVNEVVIVPNLIKSDQYNRLGDYMVEELGYERQKDFFEFAYDWRQDVRRSARQLGALIETLPSSQPVTLIGHSLGAMVSRYYLECLGGKERVERVILLGGPHQGSVKIMMSLLIAPKMLPFGLMGERLRQVLLTFPSSYQIIPTYPCASDQYGNAIHFLKDEAWLPEEYIPMLRQGKRFRKEIGNTCSVPALSVFGYGMKTISHITLERDSNGKPSNIVYQTEPGGDSSVLEKSAVLRETDIHPVQQYHGSLFVDNDVKMRLKVELARQFST